jgi:hypothetical protein
MSTNDNTSRVTGWWVLAGIFLFVAGVLDIIYGIAAIGESKYFTQDVTLVITDLKTYGWVVLVIGIIQLTAGLSLFGGGGWGRFVGIIGAALNAIVALQVLPAAPFWSLAIFLLSIVILYELVKAPERSY